MKLLFVLACCHKDVAQALDLVKWMVELETTCEDRALLVTSSSLANNPEVPEIIYQLQKIFAGGVQHLALTDEEEGGPWNAKNFMFRSSAVYIEHLIKDIDAFYFVEPDCLPIREGWWDLLKDDYAKGGLPFMGNVLALSSQPGSPAHMNGAGFYPRELFKFSVLALRAEAQPWDAVAREEIVPQAHPTKLLATYLNTTEYREVDGEVIAQMLLLGAAEKIEVKINMKAAVIHGCKDGSLLKLLLKRRTRKIEIKSVAEPRRVPLPTNVRKMAEDHKTEEINKDVGMRKRAMASTALSKSEEKSVQGLITTLELFCQNDRRREQVKSMLLGSSLLSV